MERKARTFMWLYPWWWKRNNIKRYRRRLPMLQKGPKAHCPVPTIPTIFRHFPLGLAPWPGLASGPYKISFTKQFRALSRSTKCQAL